MPEMSGKTYTDLSRLLSVDYEVFGIVQGVFFRKYTSDKAKQLGLKGFVKNTRRGTVVGVIQGPKREVADMKRWLCNEGSPGSVIKNCEFHNEREIINPDYAHFQVEGSDW